MWLYSEIKTLGDIPRRYAKATPGALALSCGAPLPQVEIKIVDSHGDEVPDGHVGEFLIHSPSLATGYFNQPEMPKENFGSGWYRSGDAGYRDQDGHLYIVDRAKEEVFGHCRKLDAGYKVPNQVHFVDLLPMTASGKIRKRTLAQRFQGAGE